MFAERVIQAFGGVPALADALTEVRGRKVPYRTVWSWGDRGSIPAGALPDIKRAALNKNVELSFDDLIDPTETNGEAA